MDLSIPPFPNRRKSRLSSPTDHFKFTPIAISKKAPRLWDRKPMTPFNSRSRSHKVWKRFQASTSNDVGGDGIGHDVFLIEINNSFALRGVLRGVKRRCTAACVGVERGRSFQETKWETEDMGTRQRKCVPRPEVPRWESIEDAYIDSDVDNIQRDENFDGHQCDEQKAVDRNDFGLGLLARQWGSTSPVSDQTLVNDLLDSGKTTEIAEQHIDGESTSMQESSGMLAPEDLEIGDRGTPVSHPDAATAIRTSAKIDKAAEEATTPLSIPPSRLLFPTLEGDDADFITDFLSQAQAKRAAAKSVLPSKGLETAVWESQGRSPTPRARKILEDIDKNSPTSLRQQVSPSKLRQISTSPSPKSSAANHELEVLQEELCQNIGGEEEEYPQQPRVGSPCRRSTRKTPSRTQRNTPAIPNHIPFRRSNGTEFVFLQRSEEQQLSLVTKANTRRNKGDAKFPCFVLQAINSKEYEPICINNGETVAPISPRKSPRKRIRIVKKVMWDDEHLVQYDGETYNNDEQNEDIGQASHSPKLAISQSTKLEEKKRKNPNPNITRKNSNSSKAYKLSVPIHSDPQSVKSPTIKRRVPRLGFSGNNDHSNISHNSVAPTGAAAAAAPASGKTSTGARHPGTPIHRKKLAPKSPKAIVFKVSDDRAPKMSTATSTDSGIIPRVIAAPTTRATTRKFSGSCLPRHTGRTKV
ncbi:hypothetical protein I7I53_09633 [Histoplasma capsulatum var. duboisii H88]|uniref:Uncharacterized protein n=1 Tax=Ajellomyces capsulatus (strain H88) TaxID=544711 RepID=A0A8A1L5T5_AJEC8|nr:hypothetical protein I7I53_09633 [Histoplasma capsulatum var. duboisii H88]